MSLWIAVTHQTLLKWYPAARRPGGISIAQADVSEALSFNVLLFP